MVPLLPFSDSFLPPLQLAIDTSFLFSVCTGDVYEHMYQWAQKEPLNNPPFSVQPPGYEKYLKKLLTGEVIQEAFQLRLQDPGMKQTAKL